MSTSIISPPSLPPPSDQIYTAPTPTAADQINDAIDAGVQWGADKIGDGIDWLGDRISEGMNWMDNNGETRRAFGDCLDAVADKSPGKAINDCYDAIRGLQDDGPDDPDGDGYM
jgi:hypothetical protein